jgi:SAM-dependent methyltransferase
MTDEMLALARENQAKAGATNVDFLKGTIEEIPLPDDSVDVIISNCVINLSADKDSVLREAFRVLKPGGRFAVSDIVLERALPESVQGLVALWTGCVAGALQKDDYAAKLKNAGFEEVSFEVTRSYDREAIAEMANCVPRNEGGPEAVLEHLDMLDGAVVSAFIRARRPGA